MEDDIMEKAILALRKYISENREQVRKDLDKMREQSDGKSDVYSYFKNFSKNFISVKENDE